MGLMAGYSRLHARMQPPIHPRGRAPLHTVENSSPPPATHIVGGCHPSPGQPVPLLRACVQLLPQLSMLGQLLLQRSCHYHHLDDKSRVCLLLFTVFALAPGAPGQSLLLSPLQS